MGELILCKNSIAEVPYFLEGPELHLYSVEELARYVLKNLYTADRDLMNEEFTDWVEEQLKERELAARLKGILKGGRPSAYQFLMTILLGVPGYIRQEEIKNADTVLKTLQSKTPFERAKLLADKDLSDGHPARAIVAYRELIEEAKDKTVDAILLGNIWNNLGTAYAFMFLFREAEQCFGEAFKKNLSPETKKAMERCRECIEGGFEPGGPESEPELEKTIELAEEARGLKDDDGCFDRYREYSNRLKAEYRRLSQMF